jgi:hypothetical protein
MNDKEREGWVKECGCWLDHGSMATGFEIQAQLMFIDMGASGKVVGLAVSPRQLHQEHDQHRLR